MFKALVLARIIEPTSKLDSLRVLAEAGVQVAAALWVADSSHRSLAPCLAQRSHAT